MTQRTKILLFAMLAVLVAGSFYLRSLARRIFVESPKQAEENVRTRLNEVALQSRSGAKETATLYFPSPNVQLLAAESRAITWADNDPDRIRQVLLALIEGSHQGLGRALPSSTNVRAVFLGSDGTAYVDFSSDVLNGFNPGIETETLAVYSVVNSIAANVPAAKRVKILLQGQEADSLDGHADLSEAFIPDPSRIQTAAP